VQKTQGHEKVIYGIGTDIIEVKRIKKAVVRFGNRFIRRIFTEHEIRYCENKANSFQHFAVRFAAKEALLKAIGIGLRDGILWRQIEIRNDDLGKPQMFCSGICKKKLNELHVKSLHVSLSHIEKYGVATIILEN